MNTKLKHLDINPEFSELFAFQNPDEERRHNAQMISYRILSEVERLCEELDINKKQLAERVGASASYITQLFRGAKQVNTDIMARFEEALEMSFEIQARMDRESENEFVFNQVEKLGICRFKHKRMYWAGYEAITPSNGCSTNAEATVSASEVNEIVSWLSISAKDENKQIA
jgi:plasmid maintenance system antidote protein VapI